MGREVIFRVSCSGDQYLILDYCVVLLGIDIAKPHEGFRFPEAPPNDANRCISLPQDLVANHPRLVYLCIAQPGDHSEKSHVPGVQAHHQDKGNQ